MLHIFFGAQAVSVRKKAFLFITAKQEEGFEFQKIEAESYTEGLCANIASSLSLFDSKTIYLLDTPSSHELFQEELQAVLPVLKESSNIFVIIENALLAPAKKTYVKYSDSVEEITGDAPLRYNAFAMADSLALRDKKTLWLQLQDAKHAGLSSEEIIGTLWWQLKTLRLAKSTQSAEEAGMKDFPYNKAKRSLKNFKEGDIEELSVRLLALYHEGHLGNTQIDLSLEKWALTIS